MRQSRLESLLEAFVNTGSGFFVAMAVMEWVVKPYWGLTISTADNAQITSVFLFVNVLRGYLWRRFFAHELHRKVHNLLGGRVHE